MKSKYAKVHKLSIAQENILCNIQRATYENDILFLENLPGDVLGLAQEAQNEYRKNSVSELLVELDDQLCELVKSRWDKKGIAISK